MAYSERRLCWIVSDSFDPLVWSLSGHMTEHFVSEQALAVTTT